MNNFFMKTLGILHVSFFSCRRKIVDMNAIAQISVTTFTFVLISMKVLKKDVICCEMQLS